MHKSIERNSCFRLIAYFAFFVASSQSKFAHSTAIDLSQLEKKVAPPSPPNSFLIPNERYPNELRPHLALVPSGVYITVGADRALFPIILSDLIENIIVVDFDPNVIKFHTINSTLIKAARNAREYRRLRFGTSGDTDIFDTDVLSKEDRLWWNQNIVYAVEGVPHVMSQRVRGEFAGVNYIYEEIAFSKVKRFIEEGRFHFVVGDLSDSDFLSALANVLKKSKAIVSALDLSNAWHLLRYANRFTTILQTLNSVLVANSRVIFSYVLDHASSRLDPGIAPGDRVRYASSTVNQIEQVGSEAYFSVVTDVSKGKSGSCAQLLIY